MISAMDRTVLVLLANDRGHQKGYLTTLMSFNEMNICPEYNSRVVVRSIPKFIAHQVSKPK